MEIYMDDMLVKSPKVVDYVSHLDITFPILRKYRMKLNTIEMCLWSSIASIPGYIVNQRKIEANPKKIKALIEMKSPQKSKEV